MGIINTMHRNIRQNPDPSTPVTHDGRNSVIEELSLVESPKLVFFVVTGNILRVTKIVQFLMLKSVVRLIVYEKNSSIVEIYKGEQCLFYRRQATVEMVSTKTFAFFSIPFFFYSFFFISFF
jgi:hypothetical protein